MSSCHSWLDGDEILYAEWSEVLTAVLTKFTVFWDMRPWDYVSMVGTTGLFKDGGSKLPETLVLMYQSIQHNNLEYLTFRYFIYHHHHSSIHVSPEVVYCKRSASVFHHCPISNLVACFPINSMKQNAVIFFWEAGCSLWWARNFTGAHQRSLS